MSRAIFLSILPFLALLSSGGEAADSPGLNPLHTLCLPCVAAVNAAKNANKVPTVKNVEISTCNTVLKNEVVCNGAVNVASMYLSFTSAEKICEGFRFCVAPAAKSSILKSPLDVRSILRAPVSFSAQDPIQAPDALTKEILEILNEEGAPNLNSGSNSDPNSRRFKRQTLEDAANVGETINTIIGNSEAFRTAFYDFVQRFEEALNVYLNGTTSQGYGAPKN